MKIGRLFIHMYHSGKDIAFANLLFHKSNRFAKKALTSAFFLPSKNSGLAVIRGSTKHGAVLAGFAVCRLDTGVYLLPIPLVRLYDMKIILTAGNINVRVAGVFLFGALMVCFQRSSWPGFVLCKSEDCVFCHLPPFPSLPFRK